MRIQFLGSGDAFGSGGRFNTCILVEAAASVFLIDCGASSLIAMRRFQVAPNRIHTIFISHLHGDHFGGLPFFILDAQLVSRRVEPLTIVGPPGMRQRLAEAMEVLFPGSSRVERKFAIESSELDPGTPAVVNGVRVTPYLVVHTSGAPPLALRFEVDGRVVTYSGDTEWTASLVPAACGADLFIAEAYFFEKQVKFHLDYQTLRRHLGELRPKRLILTHMSQDMLARLGGLEDEAADDGKVVEI